MSPKTALIVRATGSQGKGVIKNLANSSWNIHALVSDPEDDRAQALKKYGNNVVLHRGTLADTASVEAAIKGCDAVFLTQIPSFNGDSSEVCEACTFLELAKAAGVKHIVFTTQIGLSEPNMFDEGKIWNNPAIKPAVAGKFDVEKLVRDSGIPWTILRPGWFMSNILDPIVNFFFPDIGSGKIITSYKKDGIIGAVDPDDIGAFVAAAFNYPEKFAGKHVPIVSENITSAEMIQQFSEATGKKYDVHYRTNEETAAMGNNPFIFGQTMTHGLEKWAPMDEMKSWDIPLTSFWEFLKKNKDKLP